MKNIVIMLSVLFLVGCASTKVVPILEQKNRTTLEVSVPSPLDLQDVKWKVVEVDGKLVFMLTADDYAKLSDNAEKIQNQLNQYYNIINKQKQYYEGNK